MDFKKSLALALVATSIAAVAGAAAPDTPMEKRTGKTSVVYFTKDLSAAGLQKVYNKINKNLTGKIAIKLHTGEPKGPNIFPREWIKEFQAGIPNSTLVDTNTYYRGKRFTTAEHRETIAINGWNFSTVDIMDEDGVAFLPLKGGKHFTVMAMGNHILNYDSMLVLTHFKGHALGGFGGSNKNIGIGNADGRIGKRMIHSRDLDAVSWNESDKTKGIYKDELMETISESSKATLDHFGKKIAYINVLRNMSVDCDCAGVRAKPPTLPDVGIFASTDILAVDQASIDKVYEMFKTYPQDLKERIESRHGLHQLEYMKELKMGNDKYVIVDLDK